MEYYSAIKRNEIVSFAKMWMGLEPIIHSKLERQKQVLYMNAYMWNLEKWYRWTYLKSRNRDTDVENKYMDIKGAGRVDELGIWDWHIHTAMYKIDN